MPGVPEEERREARISGRRRRKKEIPLSGHWVQWGPKTNSLRGMVPWGDKISEKCRTSRQWVLVLGKDSEPPVQGGKAEAVNKSRPQGLGWPFTSLKITRHITIVSRCTSADVWCKSAENWTTGSHSTKTPSTGSQDSCSDLEDTFRAQAPSSDFLLLQLEWGGGALVSCSLPHGGHMGCQCQVGGPLFDVPSKLPLTVTSHSAMGTSLLMSLEKWRVLVGHFAAPNKWNKEEWISGGI